MYQNWIMFCATLISAATAMAETHTVLANNTSFVPDTIEVLPGDTIIWQYNSGYPHTVVSGVDCTASGLFYGELPSFGDTFSWEAPLDLSGEFSYFCAPHCGNGTRFTSAHAAQNTFARESAADTRKPIGIPQQSSFAWQSAPLFRADCHEPPSQETYAQSPLSLL